MKITYIRLAKFKRLMLSDIMSFEWSPMNDLMVILGSNGSGKSSILSEMTPLPARHVNFNKGGEKIIHCTYRGDVFKLQSIYNSGTGSHSFIKNDIELNTGSTFKIQEELCFREFGLTQELHDIATGKVLFSSLSTAKRRELLTKMSPVDLDYAFGVYGKIRHEHRSHKGVMDLITKRLVSENINLPSDNEVSLLQDKNKALTDRLGRLYREKSNGITPTFKDQQQPLQRLTDIQERAKAILKTYIRIPDDIRLSGEDNFTTKVELLRLQESNLKAIIDRMAEELELLVSQTPKDIQVTEEDVEVLKTKHSVNISKLKELDELISSFKCKFPLVKVDLTQADPKGSLDVVFSNWLKLLSEFPENEDGLMSKENANIKTRLHLTLKQQQRELSDTYDSNNSRIARLKGCEDIICPSCTHTFKPGVEPGELNRIVNRNKEIEVKLKSIDGEIVVVERYLEEFSEYSSLVFRFITMTRDYPQYKALWDYCVNERVMYRTPSRYKTDAGIWHQYMSHMIDYELILEDTKIIEKRLAVIKEIDKDAVDYMRRRTMSLEEELNQKYVNLEEVNRFIKSLKTGELNIRNLISTVDEILDDYDKWRKDVMQQSEYLLDKAYDEEIKAIHLDIAESTQTLNTVYQHSNTVRTLENEVKTANESYGELGILIKAMSPNNGLLGRYLLGFMHEVASFVNAYISEVWTYDLEVLPSKIEKEELDYKFPLNIGDGLSYSADIVEASTGQLEIINFAFRMAILKFLNLEHLPLYLDELGGTFDDQHRANLIPFITGLIENGHFKQVFYICHFEETYGAFNQAEYMVVNPINITTPDTFNKNVIIK